MPLDSTTSVAAMRERRPLVPGKLGACVSLDRLHHSPGGKDVERNTESRFQCCFHGMVTHIFARDPCFGATTNGMKNTKVVKMRMQPRKIPSCRYKNRGVGTVQRPDHTHLQR